MTLSVRTFSIFMMALRTWLRTFTWLNINWTYQLSCFLNLLAFLHYVSSSNVKFAPCTNFYDLTVQHYSILFTSDVQSPSTSFKTTFPTARSLHQYCETMKRITVLEKSCKRMVTSISDCPINTTGCFSCPLHLLRRLLTSTSLPSFIIPFCACYNVHSNRVNSTRWNTTVFEQQIDIITTGHAVFDFNSDGRTMSNSGTKGVTVLRVQFSNIRPHL